MQVDGRSRLLVMTLVKLKDDSLSQSAGESWLVIIWKCQTMKHSPPSSFLLIVLQVIVIQFPTDFHLHLPLPPPSLLGRKKGKGKEVRMRIGLHAICLKGGWMEMDLVFDS